MTYIFVRCFKNGVDIPLDNGFPLRVLIPGVVGARSVKWLSKIKISHEESHSFWQRNDYKILSPNIKDMKDADFSKYKACQEAPVSQMLLMNIFNETSNTVTGLIKVQSAICVPATGAVVNKSDEMLTIKGYAFSGGGKDIDNVKVSVDGGNTWEFAALKKIEQPYNRYLEPLFFF